MVKQLGPADTIRYAPGKGPEAGVIGVDSAEGAVGGLIDKGYIKPPPPPDYSAMMAAMLASFKTSMSQLAESQNAQIATLQEEQKAEVARIKAEIEADRKRRETELAFKAKKGKKSPDVPSTPGTVIGEGDFVLGAVPGGKTLLGA